MISDVRVQDSSRLGSYVDVLFRYDWVGIADPTPQLCRVEVTDGSGQTVTSFTSGFAGGQVSGNGLVAADVPRESSESSESLTATVNCRGIT